MGKVMTKIRVTNMVDRRYARDGLIQPEQIRSVELEALVDTGATTLALPADVVASLGLSEIERRQVKMANGAIEELSVVGDLMVEILGRKGSCEAFVLPAGTTPLIADEDSAACAECPNGPDHNIHHKRSKEGFHEFKEAA
jgi:predicted aspartyl protease